MRINPETLARSSARHPWRVIVVWVLVTAGLAKSNGDARRTIGEGGAYVNNRRVEDPDYVPGDADVLAGGWLVLRRGKKTIAGVEITD